MAEEHGVKGGVKGAGNAVAAAMKAMATGLVDAFELAQKLSPKSGQCLKENRVALEANMDNELRQAGKGHAKDSENRQDYQPK